MALFGGAFDPIHNAHLAIAREAAARYGLQRVLVVPAARPPHKQLHAPFEDRYRMVEIAVREEPCLEASRLEAETEHSYSVETIERLKPQLAPGDELYFLIGADAFSEIRTWRRWKDVVSAVDFIVVSRPGHHYEVPAGARVHRLDTLQLSVSSSDIRRRLAEGGEPSEVPPAVLACIRERGLYGTARR